MVHTPANPGQTPLQSPSADPTTLRPETHIQIPEQPRSKATELQTRAKLTGIRDLKGVSIAQMRQRIRHDDPTQIQQHHLQVVYGAWAQSLFRVRQGAAVKV